MVLTIGFVIGFVPTTFRRCAKYYTTLFLDDFIDRYVTEVSWAPKLNQVCNTRIQTLSEGTLQLTRAWYILSRNKDWGDDEGGGALVCGHDETVLET